MNNEKAAKQLGMNPSTASTRLKKEIMFQLVKETNKDICYRCGKKIENAEELSIDHKEPWLDTNNPKELFFDLDNIAFSHHICNITSRRTALIELICDGCGKSFSKLLRRYKTLINKGQKQFFCTHRCHNKNNSFHKRSVVAGQQRDSDGLVQFPDNAETSCKTEINDDYDSSVFIDPESKEQKALRML